MISFQNKQSWVASVVFLKEKHDWLTIIKSVPFSTIHTTWIWQDARCLGEVAFAISQAEAKLEKPRKAKPKDENERKKQTQYKEEKNKSKNTFMQLINRALELDPDNQTLLSSKAYYYYRDYLADRVKKDAEEAEALYRTLTSDKKIQNYKEFYRKAMLYEIMAEEKQKDRFRKNGSSSVEPIEEKLKWRSIQEGFSNLITWYETSKSDGRERFAKEYNMSKYEYAKVFLKYIITPSNLFGALYDSKKFCKNVNSYLDFAKNKATDLKRSKEYLEDFEKYIPHEITKSTLEDYKPHLLDALYRLSQAYLSMGIMKQMISKDNISAQQYYKTGIDYGERLLDYWEKFDSIYTKFNPPYYAYIPLTYLYYLTEDKTSAIFCAKKASDLCYMTPVVFKALTKELLPGIKKNKQRGNNKSSQNVPAS